MATLGNSSSALLIKTSHDNIGSPSQNHGNATPGSTRSADKISDSSFAISRNLAEIKEKRKLMESNAQMLMNRLQALSQEEYKLKRNAVDLKKRSQDLLNHRVNRDRQKNLEEQETQHREKVKANEFDNVRQTVLEAKVKAREEVEKVKNLMQEKKKKEAQEIRQQRAWNEEMIIQAKLQHVDHQRTKSKKVKEAEEFTLVKVKEFHEVKAEIMREQREKLIREEEERILRKEREIEKLVAEEDVMLEYLNKVEEDEKQAETEYHEISKMPVNELEQKYTSYIKTDKNMPNQSKFGDESSFMNNSVATK